ncbi:MAG: hypothetical protein D3906_01280 [Candidatus Electrothrix sp. AUS1_2]|nr:hypothetical protein [Candidatus Electrothrix sp. AUS1_2]
MNGSVKYFFFEDNTVYDYQYHLIFNIFYELGNDIRNINESPVSETYQFRSSPGGSLVFKIKSESGSEGSCKRKEHPYR